ncbi:penicillin-binding protein activator [Pseudohongiella spirulinae]|uniref:LppC putative lipoprotein n=1 Tax=Pseudohongiella spirulinae TaxID=1249552 RepID=A0A0S2KF36_9GAMM|nr:penicillin-binding protein activator [Pseudohongiella spirulinae]ALO46944.1 LppC putative lipoprotein [Pseudohongiella spirulinae]
MHPKTLLVLLFSLLILGCAGSGAPGSSTGVATSQESAAVGDEVNDYLALAADAESPQAEILLISAAEIALEAGSTDTAAAILSSISASTGLPVIARARESLALARIALARDDADTALSHLDRRQYAPDTLSDDASGPEVYRQIIELRSQLLTEQGQYLAAARELSRLTGQLTATEQQQHINRIWDVLSAAPANNLTSQRDLIDSYELRGWVELLNAVRNSGADIEQQVVAVNRWQDRWNQHSAVDMLPESLAFAQQLLQQRPQRIALLLPLGEAAGRAVSEGFLAAYYDALSKNQATPDITLFDTTAIIDIMPLYRQAAESGADLIIGPLRKESVRQLQRQQRLAVTTLALNYGDTGRLNPPGFFQFGLAPEDEIQQAARIAWQQGYRSAAVLTPAGEEFERIQTTFAEQWQNLGGQLVSTAGYGSAATYSATIERMFNTDASQARADQLLETLPRNNMEFIPRRRQDVDFIFLQANPAEGRQLKPTLGFHYAGDLPVIAMPAIYEPPRSASGNRDLNGVAFLDAPWMLDNNDPLKSISNENWPASAATVQRLRAMGIDVYRLHARLAQLQNFPTTRMQGATGVLKMRDDGAIERELLLARFVNGQAEILPAGADISP